MTAGGEALQIINEIVSPAPQRLSSRSFRVASRGTEHESWFGSFCPHLGKGYSIGQEMCCVLMSGGHIFTVSPVLYFSRARVLALLGDTLFS